MYAEVGRNTLDPQNTPSLDVLKQIQALLAKLPGYRGYMAIEGEDSQRIFVRVWDSEAAAEAARSAVEIKLFTEQHITPGVTHREQIGQGKVLHSDVKLMQT